MPSLLRLVLTAALCQAGAVLPLPYEPGTAEAALDSPWRCILRNRILEAEVAIVDGALRPISFLNRITGVHLPRPAYNFQAVGGGRRLTGHEFHARDVQLAQVRGDPAASQLGLRQNGWHATVALESQLFSEVKAEWSAELRDGANYVKIALRLLPSATIQNLTEVCLVGGSLEGASSAGQVDGVPVVSNDFFLGVEHPKASNVCRSDGTYRCCLQLGKTDMAMREPYTTLTLGVNAPGQKRRSFQHYLELARAHPSRRMLHYNTWYDIGTGQEYSAEDVRSRLHEMARQLGGRGLALDAFLLDDGWDDPDNGPWEPHAGFNVTELTSLEEAARRLKTGLGVWFSPFGGYHEPRPAHSSRPRF